MKNLIYPFVLAVSLPFHLLAQYENEIPVDVKPQAVTVFLNGAEISSTENVAVKKGRNTIIFKGLSPDLADESVQVAADNTVSLLSVSTDQVTIDAATLDGRIKSLQDSLLYIQEKIEFVDNHIDAFVFEKETLTQNQKLTLGAAASVQSLGSAVDFMRERVLKINNALTELNRQKRVLQQRQKNLEKKASLLRDRINTTRKQIVVVILAAADQKVNFALRYLVEEAGWEASYDLIASDVNKPVLLKYKAQVYNNTAIDWRHSRITLSTGDPSLGASRPYLTTWTLNYTSSGNEGWVDNKALNYFNNALVDSVQSDAGSIDVAELSASFAIDQAQTILANGQPHSLDLFNESLQASYEYLTIPKVDLSAFLVAKVTGWEKLNLINGTANIYFGNTYIGESEINTRMISDTLELSLGRDNQIIVSRTKMEDKAATKFIGARREESFRYEIVVKNNRKIPVSIKIQDQVPVSQESDIIVDVQEASGATLDKLSGRLQWKESIPSGDNVKHQISFSVKYPKNKRVDIRKNRSVRTPRYRH